MSGSNITADIINGAVRGHLIASARNNAQSAAEWKRSYNGLVAKYNQLMDEYNDLNRRFKRMGEQYKEVQKTRDEYAEMITELNERVYRMNSDILAGNADRTKAYDFILELTKVVRKHEPENKLLSNPNNILAEVNFYSAKRMKESSKLIEDELKTGAPSLFSRGNDKQKLDQQAETRTQRGNSYKNAADSGIYEVDKSITPVF